MQVRLWGCLLLALSVQTKEGLTSGYADQVGLVFSIYSFASVAASPVLGRMVQLGYIKRRSLLLAGLLVVPHLINPLSISSLACRSHLVRTEGFLIEPF